MSRLKFVYYDGPMFWTPVLNFEKIKKNIQYFCVILQFNYGKSKNAGKTCMQDA